MQQLFGILVLLTNRLIHELERIQKRAVKTILGPEYTSYKEGLSACNIDSLATRRTAQCLKFGESLSDNIRCKHLIPPTRLFLMVKTFATPTQSPS